jgi:uncharacterized membrane protein YidH (DUF202 family)
MTTVDSQAQTQGQGQQQRVEQFKQEIADMRLRDPSTARDRLLLRTGIALMVIGVGFTVVGYFLSHTTKDVLQQNDAQVSAMIGIAITIVGAALFLRYSIAQFLRFWLARLTYEQNHQTDRIVDAINET